MDKKDKALVNLSDRLANDPAQLAEEDEFPVRLSRAAVLDFAKASAIVDRLAKVKIVRNKQSGEICWPTTGEVMNAFDDILEIASKEEKGATS